MDFAESIRKIIREHGHVVLHTAPQADRYGFSYTVGRTDGGQPELLTVGMHAGLAHRRLNAAVASLLKRPMQGPGPELRELEGHPARIVEVSTEAFAAELRSYPMVDRVVPTTMLQVIWACAAGKFPGEDQYSATCEQNMARLEIPRVH